MNVSMSKTVIEGILLLAVTSMASPVYYTFEGKVDSYRYTNVVSELEIGDALKYVLLVDRDLPGISYFHSVKYTINDNPGSDVFYVGDAGGFDYDFYLHQGKNLLGRQYIDLNGAPFVEIQTLLTPNGEPMSDPTFRGDSFSLRTPGNIDDWNVGDMFNVDISGRFYGSSTMTLTGISNENPVVPEPTSLLLLASGCILLGFSRHRLKSKNR